MKRLSFLWLSLISVMAMAMGCAAAKDRPIPPDYLKFTAKALPPRAEVIAPVHLAALGERVFRADGVVTYSPGGDGAAQRLLAARANARRQALRSLGLQILATPIDEGKNLGVLLEKNPGQAGALEQLIESRSHVTFPESTGNQVVAETTLKGGELVTLFSGKDHQSPLSELAPESRESIKKASYDSAIQLARDRMHIGLLEIPLKNGRRLGDVLAENPAALRQLHAMIDTAEPDEVHYADDGACELVFFFDQNRARALAEKHNGWFH